MACFVFNYTRHGDSSHNVIVFLSNIASKKKVIDVPKFKKSKEKIHINLLVFFVGFFSVPILYQGDERKMCENSTTTRPLCKVTHRSDAPAQWKPRVRPCVTFKVFDLTGDVCNQFVFTEFDFSSSLSASSIKSLSTSRK